MSDAPPAERTRAGVPPPGWRALAGPAGDGDLDIAAAALRPLRVGELLDQPFVLLRRRLLPTLGVLAGAVVVFEMASAWLQRGMLGGLTLPEVVDDPVRAQAALDAAGGEVAGLLLSAVWWFLVLPPLAGAVTLIGLAALVGAEVSAGQALRTAVRRGPALVAALGLATLAAASVSGLGWLLMLTGNVVAAGLGLLLVLAGLPALWYGLGAFAATPAAVVIEGRGPLAALRRSAALTRGRRWGVGGVMLLALVVTQAVRTALQGLPTFAALLSGMQQGWWWLGIFGALAGLVTAAVLPLVAALVYVDRRVRREALDAVALAEQAGIVPPSDSSSDSGSRQAGARRAGSVG